MTEAALAVTLDDATLVSTGSTGAPIVPRLYNLTGPVRSFGGAILCFVGPPWKSVDWRVLEGMGEITPLTTYTDGLGRASARFNAVGIAGRVVVAVAYVP